MVKHPLWLSILLTTFALSGAACSEETEEQSGSEVPSNVSDAPYFPGEGKIEEFPDDFDPFYELEGEGRDLDDYSPEIIDSPSEETTPIDSKSGEGGGTGGGTPDGPPPEAPV